MKLSALMQPEHLGLVLAIACVIALVVAVGFALCRRPPQEARNIIAANVAEGTHGGGNVTLVLDNAFASDYLLAKRGTDASHIDICTAGDEPLGPVPDQGAAGDSVAVQLLGSVKGTVKMVASEAIAQDAYVYTAAAGKVQDEPGVAGTYYIVGKAAQAAAADGSVFEVIPLTPVPVKVITATGAADVAALITQLKLATTPCLVKFI
jgi:hypothetical protein